MLPFTAKKRGSIQLWSWHEGNIPGQSMWTLNVITSAIKREKQGRIWQTKIGKAMWPKADRSDVVTRQRNARSHKKLKGASDWFSPSASAASTTFWNFDFGLVIIYRFQAFRTMREKISMVLSAKFVVICYSR